MGKGAEGGPEGTGGRGTRMSEVGKRERES